MVSQAILIGVVGSSNLWAPRLYMNGEVPTVTFGLETADGWIHQCVLQGELARRAYQDHDLAAGDLVYVFGHLDMTGGSESVMAVDFKELTTWAAKSLKAPLPPPGK